MLKSFLENKYAKTKKENNEVKLSINRIELEVDRLINTITNLPPVDTTKMSRLEKQAVEIRTAELQQAQVFFRKALKILQKGARYLR